MKNLIHCFNSSVLVWSLSRGALERSTISIFIDDHPVLTASVFSVEWFSHRQTVKRSESGSEKVKCFHMWKAWTRGWGACDHPYNRGIPGVPAFVHVVFKWIKLCASLWKDTMRIRACNMQLTHLFTDFSFFSVYAAKMCCFSFVCVCFF